MQRITAALIPFVRRLTIRTRLGAAVALAMGALVLLAAVAVVAIGQFSGEFTAFFEHEYAAQARLARLQLLLGEMRSAEKDTVLSIDDLEAARRHQASWRDSVAGAQQALAAMRGPLPPATVDALDMQVTRYATLAGEVLQKGINGQIVTSTEEHQALQPARDALAQALPVLDGAAAGLARAAQDRQARVLQRAAERPRAIALIGGATLLLLGAALVAIGRSVTQPLAEAVRLAEGVADGNLAHEVDISGSDELAGLMRALAAMQGRLRDMVQQLHGTSLAIAQASAQLSGGGRDLSARTQQAAAHLQHSAASLSDLRALVQRAQSEALSASADGERAGTLARDGMQVVGEVAQRMAQLTQRSRRIADITGVIDTIAFQTNLLALNAAVEAARAGEQGRGFAVVAGEVRALAQRATGAAAEIRGLIDGSVQAIGDSARHADDAGERMRGLIEVIERLAAGMAPLADAARTQTRDVAQVHAAVDELNGMTQQNAALVQQSLGAAQALQSQAERLSVLVGRFRLQAA